MWFFQNIVVKNTGSNTWTLKDNYRLGAVGDSDPFAAARISMEENDRHKTRSRKEYSKSP